MSHPGEVIVKAELRILNLEDSKPDAELNEAMLTARWPGCELVRVDTRQDFIEALEKETNLGLILSDYTLPGFSGREALALARERRPEVPFLFVSGTIGEDAAIEALKNGATDYVLKHRLMRLIPAVARALAEAEEHDELKRSERAMCESEHKYRMLFECLSDAAFLVEEKSGKIIDANRQAGVVLHCFRTDILGRKESQILIADHHRTLRAGTPGGAIKGKLIRADGAAIPVGVRTTRLNLYGRPLVLRLCHKLNQPQPASVTEKC
ncbi:MAG TPA: response regulator [Candidatus Sulfopaludibacter sp.]|nr:response regulator [Candidatus Sulfopaludibacter sp.]